jgi:hypothetical protein
MSIIEQNKEFLGQKSKGNFLKLGNWVKNQSINRCETQIIQKI